MLTSKEASIELGVSTRRVIALIQSGDLIAQKFGSNWMVDEQSVATRKSTQRLKGRPKMGEKDPSKIIRYILMNKNHAVLEFSYHVRRQMVSDIVALHDVDYAPPGACTRPGKPHAIYLGSWIRNRYIPSLRPNISSVLRELGFEHQSELMFKSYGLNLSDQYWIKPDGSGLDWHQINYFENDFVDTLGRSLNHEHLSFTANNWVSPSSGTPGLLPKWWEKRDGQNYLIKAGNYLDLEPYHELLATKLYQLLLEEQDYIPYWLEKHRGHVFSVCPDMVDKDSELVSMQDVFTCYQPSRLLSIHDGYLAVCKNLGISDAETKLAKLIACDFLTANPDRHQQNLGLIRDVESLEYTGVAPIFDNGRSFYIDARTVEELNQDLFHYASLPFSEYPLAQLALAKNFDWYEPQKLQGFDQIIIETLSQNPNVEPDLARAVASQFNLRVNRLDEYAAQFTTIGGGASFD